MPRRSLVVRMANYRAKLIPERVKEDLENRRQEMIDAQAQSATELSTLEERVRGVLADEPVGVLDYLKHHNFSRQVYRAQKRFMGGYALFQEVAILIMLYTARGCIEKVLTRIRTEVFSIQAPAE